MLPLRRTYSALVLLAVFLVGGLGAPVVHHLDHRHKPSHRHETPKDASQARGGWLVKEVYQSTDCAFCAVVKLSSGLTGQALRPLRQATLLRAAAPVLFASRAHFSRAIRGPPVSS